MSIQVNGLRDVVRKLEQFGIEASELKESFRVVGTIVLTDARNRAPVLTGKLRNTIKISKTKNKSVIRAGSSVTPYAGVIHYGGYNNIVANPFLTDALSAKQGEVVQTFEEEITRLVTKANN